MIAAEDSAVTGPGERQCELKCPHCGALFQARLAEVVDAQSRPELKRQLLSSEFNRVVCPTCEYMFLVETEVLYRDREKGVLLYLLPGAEERWEQAEEMVKAMLADYLAKHGREAEAWPDVQLVFSRAEMVERIFLLDRGYDVAAIEYVKYLIYTRNRGRVNPRTKRLLFNAQDSDEERLWFVIQDLPSRRLEGMLQFDQRAYRAVTETFRQPEGERMLRKLFPGPVVNARLKILAEEAVEETPEAPEARRGHSAEGGATGESSPGDGRGTESDSGSESR